MVSVDRQDLRVALVTGGNRGLGYEVVRQLAQAGMRVLLGARAVDDGRRAAAECTAAGLDVHPVRVDVTDEATLDTAAGIVATEHGRLDVLVNNAGTTIELSP